jgi:hypothetical protein
MGEAKRKLRDHAAILAGNPGCIYCDGENIATAIEHMPPISVFEGRQRGQFVVREGTVVGKKQAGA